MECGGSAASVGKDKWEGRILLRQERCGGQGGERGVGGGDAWSVRAWRRAYKGYERARIATGKSARMSARRRVRALVSSDLPVIMLTRAFGIFASNSIAVSRHTDSPRGRMLFLLQRPAIKRGATVMIWRLPTHRVKAMTCSARGPMIFKGT